MSKLYITCNPDNIPSRKTCEKLGLILEEIVDLPEDNEMYKEGERKNVDMFGIYKDASKMHFLFKIYEQMF